MKKTVILLALFNLVFSICQSQIVKEWRSANEFRNIEIRGPFECYLIQEDFYEVYIEADQEIVKNVETTVKEQTLYIGTIDNSKMNTMLPVKIYIKAPEISKIKIIGSALLKSLSLKAQKLEIELVGTGNINIDELLVDFLNTRASGSGKVEMDVNAEEILIDVTGTGSIALKGHCGKTYLKLNGTGEINTAHLNADTCKARIIGTGNIYVSARDKMNAEIFGSGNIYYSGDAEISLYSLGTGKIIKLK